MHETLLELPPLPGGALRLLGWSVRPGQVLRRGDSLCLVEQDGRVLDVPALRGGVVCRLLARPGTLPACAPLAALREPPRSGESDLALAGGTLHLQRWVPPGAARGTCLLLHGFGGSLEAWVGTAAMIAAEGFVAVAPDLPAHGGTTVAADSPHAIAALLGDAWAAMELTGPVHVVGHSMGGAVAVLLASVDPARLASLTLIAPLGFAPGINGGFIARLLAARAPESLADALRPLTARPVNLPPEVLAATLTALHRHAGPLARLAASLAEGDRQRLDLTATLAALMLPARLIVGEADAVLPWAAFAPPPHIPLHRLACGHVPHWEQPRLMRRLLAQRDWQPATGEPR